jgi:hypothetical protein
VPQQTKPMSWPMYLFLGNDDSSSGTCPRRRASRWRGDPPPAHFSQYRILLSLTTSGHHDSRHVRDGRGTPAARHTTKCGVS